MGYRCRASKDMGCDWWDNGKVCKNCIKDNICLYFVETLDLKKCECGAKEEPCVYCEGIGRREFEYKGDFQRIRWKELDGYAVECKECGVSTKFCQSIEEAVNNWNNKIGLV